MHKHFSVSFLFKILFIARNFSQCTQPTRPLWRPHSVDVVMLHVSSTFCWCVVFLGSFMGVFSVHASPCSSSIARPFYFRPLCAHCQLSTRTSIKPTLDTDSLSLSECRAASTILSNCFHLVAPSSEMRQNRKQFHVLHRSSGLIFKDCIAQWWSQSYIINNR